MSVWECERECERVSMRVYVEGVRVGRHHALIGKKDGQCCC